MLNILKKYNQLPQEIRDKLSSPEVLRYVKDLEERFDLNLASVVMQVMIKGVGLEELTKYLIFEKGVNVRAADIVSRELKEKVFSLVTDYLSGEDNGEDNTELNNDGTEESIKIPQTNINEKVVNIKQDEKANIPLVFSDEDEQELNNYMEQVGDLRDKKKILTEDLNKKVEIVVQKLGISFASEELMNRFKQVIRTYIKGIRNRIDTKQTLMRSVDLGGLNMDNKTIDRAVLIADKLIEKDKKFVLPRRMILPEDNFVSFTDESPTGENELETTSENEIGVPKERIDNFRKNYEAIQKTTERDAAYDFTALGRKKEIKKPVEEVREEEIAKKNEYESEEIDDNFIGKEETSSNEILDLNKENLGEKLDEKLVDKKEEMVLDLSADEKQYLPKRQNTFLPKGKQEVRPKQLDLEKTEKKEVVEIDMVDARREQGNYGSKIRMQDVKPKLKLMGPVEELGDMNLNIFMRLGDNPKERCDKIRDKISFLEEESYSRKIEGVQAWRQSPVNKLYLLMGRESIQNSKPVSEIIEERKNSGKPVLSESDMNAIMELNKDIRF